MPLLALLTAALLASPPTSATPPALELVTLVTPPWSPTTELRQGPRTVARFTHLPDAAVRGAMVPGTGQVVAVADTAPRRDPSFAASLFLLAADLPARRLCDDVVHASRPLAAPDGRVYIARGVAGPDGPPGELRTDFLRVDAVDRDTGVARTVHAYTGQLLHLAGWHRDALVLYRIDPDGADLVLVDRAAPHAVHPLTDLPPFARDFSVDDARGRLVFLERDDDDAGTWNVEQVDLLTGERAVLLSDVSQRAQPFAASAGTFAAPTGGALERLDIGPPPRSPCAALGLPGCVDLLRLAGADGRHAAGLHVRPGALPRPFVLDMHTGESTLPPAPNAWVELVALTPAEAAR